MEVFNQTLHLHAVVSPRPFVRLAGVRIQMWTLKLEVVSKVIYYFQYESDSTVVKRSRRSPLLVVWRWEVQEL